MLKHSLYDLARIHITRRGDEYSFEWSGDGSMIAMTREFIEDSKPELVSNPGGIEIGNAIDIGPFNLIIVDMDDFETAGIVYAARIDEVN